MNAGVVLLWAVVAAAILIIVGTFATLVYTGRITLGPDASSTLSPAPEETGIVDVSYAVLILNGTADEGADARMRDVLVSAGWSGDDVIAGPIGTTDFSITTVYYVLEGDRAAAMGLADLIGGADVVLSDHYADADDPDARQLTVVIGAQSPADADDDPAARG